MFSPSSLQRKPSRHLLFAYLLLTSACCYLLSRTQLPLWQTALALIAIFAVLGHVIWRDVLLKSQHSIMALSWTNDGKLMGHTRDGRTLNLQASGNSIIHPWLSVLVLQEPNRWRRYHVLLSPDGCLSHDNYRRFRVWLKYCRHHAPKDLK